MTRTNFEAWRDQLTPEMAYKLLGKACDVCPSRKYCDENQRVMHPGGRLKFSCEDLFTLWALAPAKEEATK